jgi:hypothetical protein
VLKLEKKYGKSKTKTMVDSFSERMATNDREYKNHYKAIRRIYG